MKKHSRHLILSVILSVVLAAGTLLSSCGSNSKPSGQESSSSESTVPDSSSSSESSSSSSESSSPDSEDASSESTAEISEKAMQNFLDKLTAGNYVLDTQGFFKATAFSEDLVTFEYEDEAYNDFAVMSVNNEVFQGILKDDAVADAAFLTEGTALEAAGSRLPSSWIELADGNIYNLFYNDTEDPLKFVSYDQNIQDQLRSMAGYGNVALKYMHEVYLTLDQEDPSIVHIQAEVDDDEVARYYFDDIDIVITFGNAQADPRAEAWMKDPVYPEARTEWSEGDLFIFNSVFLPGYGEQAVPFIPSASYALTVDNERFVSDDTVYIRDPHGTQADAANYADVLKQAGFTEVTEEDGTYYRSLLREETSCYSSISIEYNDGLNVTARKYYEFPEHEGLDAVNEVITANGYPALPETEAITDITAEDRQNEQTESWLYFYNYKTVLYVYAHYSNNDDAAAYLDDYAAGLTKEGYSPVWVDGIEDGEIDHSRSEDESMSFRYHFEDDNETVILLFKAEKCLSAAEAEAIIADAGFPAIDFSAYVTGRNHTNFQKVMYGKTYDSALTLSMKFETAEEGEAFLDKFAADLEDADFLRVPPSDLGSSKQNGYTNEETGLGVAFDFIPAEDGGETYIYFDFKSGIDFEAESDMQDEDGGSKPILGTQHLEEILNAD